MQNTITELVFILDKSGSMRGKELDTIGGFNAMIEKQKKEEGQAFVSTILFSNESQMVHDRKNIKEITALTENDFVVGGNTALLDAIGGAIKHISIIHKYARKEDVPANTIFIITTDGLENASCTYNREEVKEMIKTQQEEYGWEFLFLGANIDAVETGASFGFKKERVANYDIDTGAADMFCALEETISDFRRCGKIKKTWAEKIEETNKANKKGKV